jgi:predicted RNA-binding Zn ribbon-like protein
MWVALEFTRAPAVRDFPSLLRWSAEHDVVGGVDLAVIARYAAEHVGAAAELVTRANAFRDLFHSILSAMAAREPVAESAIERLNQTWRSIALQRRMALDDGLFGWSWRPLRADDAPLERVLCPIVQSAMDLLASPALSLVKRCPARDCGRLFLDTSRNGSRRWCDMKGCGNRAKVRRFRDRRKAAG